MGDELQHYKQKAIEMLKRKRFLEDATDNLEHEIAFLEEHSKILNSFNDISADEAIHLNEIRMKLFDISSRYLMLYNELEPIKYGYTFLSTYQRDTLDIFFVENEGANGANIFADTHHKERSQAYRDREKALGAFISGLLEFEKLSQDRRR